VMIFWANVRFSNVGILACDACVEIEVVYHHIFFVFGQRSVYVVCVCIFSQNACVKNHTGYL
jgi:hypothetical protein